MVNRRPKLLLVDDGNRYVEIAHALLRDYDWVTRCELEGPCWTCPRRPDCQLTHAHNWSETAEALVSHPNVDVVLLDVVFDLPEEQLILAADGDLSRSRRLQGVEILRRLRKREHTLPVILMTSKRELSFESAAEALEVDEYVTLAETDAFDARAIGLLIERILARQARTDEDEGYIFGTSAAMARLKRDATVLSRTSLPMLILGEPGCGKSALAERVIHPLSRRKGPFVVADLAAIPENLVAAQLFGTVQGAYSGAVERAGWIEKARGGTLFLDEIGTLSPDLQRMLLVTLQNGRFSRLGALEERVMDVKLVAGTNTDLAAMVKKGTFRDDLFARLNPAAALTLPPLRARGSDLRSLAVHLIEKTFRFGPNRDLLLAYMEAAGLDGGPHATLELENAPQSGQGVSFVITAISLSRLMRHPFPGNVRELEYLLANVSLFALSDALRAAERGRGGDGQARRAVFLPEKLVREMLMTPGLKSDTPTTIDAYPFEVTPRESLRGVSRHLEIQLMTQLYHEAGGDFERMAERLLHGDPAPNAKRVRLRFNQLGLRAIDMRRTSLKKTD